MSQTNLTISRQNFPGKNHKVLPRTNDKARIIRIRPGGALRTQGFAGFPQPWWLSGPKIRGSAQARGCLPPPLHPPGQPACPCAAPNLPPLITHKCLEMDNQRNFGIKKTHYQFLMQLTAPCQESQ